MDPNVHQAGRLGHPGGAIQSNKEETLRNLLLSAHSHLDRIAAIGDLIERATIGSSVTPRDPSHPPANEPNAATHGLFVAKALDMRLEEFERFLGNIADRL